MTVAELIEMLGKYPKDFRVYYFTEKGKRHVDPDDLDWDTSTKSVLLKH